MATTLDEIIKQVWHPMMVRRFKDHPNGKNIVAALEANQLTFDEVDLVFAEAERYSWKKLERLSHDDWCALSQPLPMIDKCNCGGGTVTGSTVTIPIKTRSNSSD